MSTSTAADNFTVLPAPPETENDNNNNGTESLASTTSVNEDYNAMTSAVSDGLDILVVVAGVVGVLANGLVSTALIVSKQLSQEKVNILILNQTILDFVASFMIMVIYSLRAAKVYLTGVWGYWLCILVLDELIMWTALNGSTANLVIIGIERYVMIAYPIWHKNHVKKWMIRSAVAFCWIDGILLNAPVAVLTSGVVDGSCLSYYFWTNSQAGQIYGIWYFFYFYVSALVSFVFCYGRILMIVRRRLVKTEPNNFGENVSGAVQPSTSSAKANIHQAQLNVIKTMLTITVAFVVCWLPNSLYYFLTCATSVWNYRVYRVTLVLAFLNICLNPIIYASQYDVIRHRLKQVRQNCRQFVVNEVVMANAKPIEMSNADRLREATRFHI